MPSTTLFPPDSPRRAESREQTRRHSPMDATLYWHGSLPHNASHGSWAVTASSPAPVLQSHLSLQITSPSPVDEHRRSHLAAKSITGLHTLFATIRSKSREPQSRHSNHRRPHSTSSIADISSLDVDYALRSYLQTTQPSSHPKPDVRPDLSALVPDYLDDPPAYSSPVQARQEVIDWQAHFERTPILARTVSPHSSPAIQNVVSPVTSSGGAWDRVAGRLRR